VCVCVRARARTAAVVLAVAVVEEEEEEEEKEEEVVVVVVVVVVAVAVVVVEEEVVVVVAAVVDDMPQPYLHLLEDARHLTMQMPILCRHRVQIAPVRFRQLLARRQHVLQEPVEPVGVERPHADPHLRA
jgi:hypothetical protein